MDTKWILVGLALSAIAFVCLRCYVYFIEKDIRKLEKRNAKLERDNKMLSAAWLQDEEALRIMSEIAEAKNKEATNATEYGVVRTTPIKKDRGEGYFSKF